LKPQIKKTRDGPSPPRFLRRLESAPDGLAAMRASQPPVRHLLGTPKGRLTQLEKKLTDLPWTQARNQAHNFVAFLALCLNATLRGKLRPLAPGLTPRAVLESS
jgi:hypothetical protein